MIDAAHAALLRALFSTHSYKAGSKIKVKNVELNTPPITTVANGLCTSAPALLASAIGTNPKLATSAVISTGRNRVSAPSRTASATPWPRSRN